MTDIRDRYAGVLLGLATGDALGGPLEFMSPDEIVQRYGNPVRDMVGGGWLYLRPGETTDDTATARCLAESLVSRGAFDADDFVARMLAWLDTNPKDVGTITRMALGNWSRGLRGRDAGHAAHISLGGKSAGNGTLMRCAPLALRYRANEPALVAAARAEAETTHFDAEAWTSDVALCLVLVALLEGGEPRAAVEGAIERLAHIPDASPAVADTLRAALGRRGDEGLGTSGYVLHTLEGAAWLLVASPSFEAMLVRGVNLGGDADTLGAVAGALGGAHWGASAIPARWLSALQGRAELEALAEQLYERSSQ
jgi:ADP-ribosyl-[dinitrogen reductase] hydrolase